VGIRLRLQSGREWTLAATWRHGLPPGEQGDSTIRRAEENAQCRATAAEEGKAALVVGETKMSVWCRRRAGASCGISPRAGLGDRSIDSPHDVVEVVRLSNQFMRSDARRDLALFASGSS
jgi:hypothetical protein